MQIDPLSGLMKLSWRLKGYYVEESTVYRYRCCSCHAIQPTVTENQAAEDFGRHHLPGCRNKNRGPFPKKGRREFVWWESIGVEMRMEVIKNAYKNRARPK